MDNIFFTLLFSDWFFLFYTMSQLLERFNIMDNKLFLFKVLSFCFQFFSFMHRTLTLSKRLLKCVSVCQWVILSIQICRHRFGWQSFTWACVRLKLVKQQKTFTADLTRILQYSTYPQSATMFSRYQYRQTEKKPHKGRPLVQALFLMDVVCLGERGRCVISPEVGFGSNWHSGCKHEASNQCCSGQTGLLIDMLCVCVCVTRIRDRLHWQLSVWIAQFLLP